jgi:hypothetical protein
MERMTALPSTLADYRKLLTPDQWRQQPANRFSEDLAKVNEVLHDPFASDPMRSDILTSWLGGKDQQPCLFGRIAAKNSGMQFCFLTIEDILESDEHVAAKIAASRRLWKQRALRGEPRHGFMLVVCDPKVCKANPDQVLYQFALHLQRLARWPSEPGTRGNDVVYEWLYLRHPKTGEIVKFTFSVDFFASAGDKRWWHDHRAPGGLAFTANSLGQMVRHKEWYLDKTDQTEWAVRTAMLTINAAKQDLPHGPATYLLDESHGRPIRPYPWTAATKPSDAERLSGKDCGSYGGYLHTDHAVRLEFFQPHGIPPTKDEPYLMDFKYIFDDSERDNRLFMQGEPVTVEHVEAELGAAEDLRFIAADSETQETTPPPGEALTRLEEIIAECRKWRITNEELAGLG